MASDKSVTCHAIANPRLAIYFIEATKIYLKVSSQTDQLFIVTTSLSIFIHAVGNYAV